MAWKEKNKVKRTHLKRIFNVSLDQNTRIQYGNNMNASIPNKRGGRNYKILWCISAFEEAPKCQRKVQNVRQGVAFRVIPHYQIQIQRD